MERRHGNIGASLREKVEIYGMRYSLEGFSETRGSKRGQLREDTLRHHHKAGTCSMRASSCIQRYLFIRRLQPEHLISMAGIAVLGSSFFPASATANR
jgi:hypothetical protein